jgi:hypothetical protein
VATGATVIFSPKYYDKVLKEVYSPTLVKQLTNEVFAYNRFRKRKDGWTGRQFHINIHIGRTGGIGMRDELDDLPDADSQKYEDLTYKVKHAYGRLQVTGQAMNYTGSDRGSTVRALGQEVEGLKDDLVWDATRQFFGTGTGVIATISSGTASATQTLTSDEPLRKGYLYKGLKVNIGTLATPTASASSATVSSVDIANSQVTFTGSVSTTTNHVISIVGNNQTSSVSNEIMGLQGLIGTTVLNDTTVGGLNPTTNPIWDNLRVNMNGTLTQDYMARTRNQIRQAGGKPSLILTSFGVRRAFWNILQSQIRYPQAKTLSGGYTALDFDGMDLVEDLHAPYGKMYFVDEDHIFFLEASPWGWFDKDGSLLNRVANKDAYEAVYFSYYNLATDRRNTQAVLYGITDPGY